MNEYEKPIIAHVHPLLLKELKIIKSKIESEVNYKIYGGMPIISKLVAIYIKDILINKKIKYDISNEENIITVIQIHPLLIECFKIMKTQIKESNINVKTNNTVVSKYIATMLQQKRRKNKNKINFLFENYTLRDNCKKVIGEKKVKLSL